MDNLPTLAALTHELVAQSEVLTANLTDQGVAAAAEDGLTANISKVMDITSVKGGTVTRRVSAGIDAIYPGEFVRDVTELQEVMHLRFAVDGVKVLAAALTGEKRVTVVFAQGGVTRAQAIKYDNNVLLLGNAVTIADQALTVATISVCGTDRAAVLYNLDGAGMCGVVTYEDRVGTLAYTDLWDADDPINITAADLGANRLLVCRVREGEPNAYLSVLTLGASEVSQGAVQRLDAAYDADEYAAAWSLAALPGGHAVISYFKDYASPVGFSVIDIDGTVVGQRYHGHCYYLGSLPATRVIALSRDCFMFANGVTRVVEGAQNKTLLTCEGWHLTQYGAKPYFAQRITEAFDTNISQVQVARLGAKRMAFGFCLESNYRTVVAGSEQTPLEAYPDVPATAVQDFGKLIPLNGTYAMMVYQAAGNGYVKVLGASPAVTSCNQRASGVAKTGGAAGTEIAVTVPQA